LLPISFHLIPVHLTSSELALFSSGQCPRRRPPLDPS
jgi:hypothetical protein